MNQIENLGKVFKQIETAQRDTIALLAQSGVAKGLIDATAFFDKQKDVLQSIAKSFQLQNFAAMLPDVSLLNAIQASRIDAERFHKSISNLVMPLFNPEFLEIFRRNIAESEKEAAEFRDFLKFHNVFITPFLAATDYGIQCEHDMPRDKDPWIYLDQLFQSETTIKDLKEHWSKNHLYNSRMQILTRALDAHRSGDFIVSIPLFLIQMDGIIADLYPGLKRMDQRKSKVNALKPKKTNSKMTAVYQDLLGESAISSIICDEILKNWFPGDALHFGVFPNRHQILHGGDTTYSEQKYSSLRCLLIVDGLEIINRLINPEPENS